MKTGTLSHFVIKLICFTVSQCYSELASLPGSLPSHQIHIQYETKNVVLQPPGVKFGSGKSNDKSEDKEDSAAAAPADEQPVEQPVEAGFEEAPAYTVED